MYNFWRICIHINVAAFLLQGSQLYGQTINYNQRYQIQNNAIIFRNINIDGDSLIITGEIGVDTTGRQGVFMITSDTLGDLGVVKIFKDPDGIEDILINGTHPVIYTDDILVFSGEYLWKSDNYFIKYDRQTGEQNYSDFTSPFIVRFTESLLELGKEFYVVGFVQTQDFDLDVFIQKIDSLGNKIWEKTYGVPSKDETGRAVIIEDDGLTIMVSESFDNTPTVKNDTRYWIRFMHVDTSGAIRRDWREEVTGYEGWSGTLLKYQKDYIYTSNTIGEEIGIGPLTGGQIVRRDSSFNLVWRKKLGEPDSPFTGLGDMIFSVDSCLLVTGQNVDSSMIFNAARIIKMGLDGNIIWELRDTGYAFPDGQSLNFMEGIASTSCNSMYAVGYTYRSAGFYEGLLLKISGDGCIDTLCTIADIEEQVLLQLDKIHIKPNPVLEELIITLSPDFPEATHLTLFNMIGQPVLNLPLTESEFNLKVGYLAPGIYHLVISNHGRVILSRKILKV